MAKTRETIGRGRANAAGLWGHAMEGFKNSPKQAGAAIVLGLVSIYSTWKFGTGIINLNRTKELGAGIDYHNTEALRYLGVAVVAAAGANHLGERSMYREGMAEDDRKTRRRLLNIAGAFSFAILAVTAVTGRSGSETHADSADTSPTVFANTPTTDLTANPSDTAVTSSAGADTLPPGNCILNGIDLGTIPKGDHSDAVTGAVKELQHMLNVKLALNPPLEEDGIANSGGPTSEAVTDFQEVVSVSGQPYSNLVKPEDPWNDAICYFTEKWVPAG